jgi:hypothetical protein
MRAERQNHQIITSITSGSVLAENIVKPRHLLHSFPGRAAQGWYATLLSIQDLFILHKPFLVVSCLHLAIFLLIPCSASVSYLLCILSHCLLRQPALQCRTRQGLTSSLDPSWCSSLQHWSLAPVYLLAVKHCRYSREQMYATRY